MKPAARTIGFESSRSTETMIGIRSMTRIPVEICEIRDEKSAVPLTKLERWRVISAHPRAAERGPETIATYEAHSLAVGPHTREIEDLRFS